jgi:hypothetical protein
MPAPTTPPPSAATSAACDVQILPLAVVSAAGSATMVGTIGCLTDAETAAASACGVCAKTLAVDKGAAGFGWPAAASTASNPPRAGFSIDLTAGFASADPGGSASGYAVNGLDVSAYASGPGDVPRTATAGGGGAGRGRGAAMILLGRLTGTCRVGLPATTGEGSTIGPSLIDSSGNGAPGGFVRTDCAAALTTATASTAPPTATRTLHIAYSATDLRSAPAKLLARRGRLKILRKATRNGAAKNRQSQRRANSLER